MEHTKSPALDDLLKEHTLYKVMKKQWIYLQASYEGGAVYRAGKYLNRYANEKNASYSRRLEATPLDNHCRSVIQVYNSFLFRQDPKRLFVNLTEDEVMPFLRDADLDGRSLNAFMKDVSTWSSVYGHVWMLLVKPNTNAGTRAHELSQEVRPYINLLTPLSVINWEWTVQENGVSLLTRFKYIQSKTSKHITVREWTLDKIVTWVADIVQGKIISIEEVDNQLDTIPAILVYNQRSPTRAIGVSDINDIADQQKFIYNLNSELEEGIRLESHPTLVIDGNKDGTSDTTKLGTGAGALATVVDLDSDNKPFMLDVTTAGVTNILSAESKSVDIIDKMANTGAVRSTQVSTLSGVAMETEFQLLNAKLAEKADNLQLAEEQMWRYYALYADKVFGGEIIYPASFNIQDTKNEIAQLATALGATENQQVKQSAAKQLLALIDPDADFITTSVTNSED